VSGNEGKSFLLAPLLEVYGEDGVFTAPPPGSFPLLGLEKARLTLLDDWRFNETLIGYPLQLLWFEGKPIVIARLQNQHDGHLRYAKDDPIFITTLGSDITKLKGKKIEEGDVTMMLKRLRLFEFHCPLKSPVDIKPCGRCFAELLLISPVGEPATGASRQRPVVEHLSAEARRRLVATWSPEDVREYLGTLGLAHVAAAFERDAVDGQMLTEMNSDDLVQHLGLTPLQAKKVLTRMA